jgi:hypothetical protein
MKKAFLLFLLIAACATPRHILSDDELKVKLQQHVAMLSASENQNRESGTKGADAAVKYLTDQFQEMGIKAKGEKKFIQEFGIPYDGALAKGTQLYVNAKSYKPVQDFYPMPFSANGIFIGYVAYVGYGIYSPWQQHDDFLTKNNLNKKIFVMESSYPENNPEKYKGFDLSSRAEYAISRGASAVIFINSDSTIADPPMDFSGINNPLSIPVVFAKRQAAQILRYSIVTNCVVEVQIAWNEKKTSNVIGFVDNKAASTVVIGAHYDHSNVRGVASLVELARYLAAKSNQHNNYLFIAFAGNSQGLMGSKYFINHPTIDIKSINYMLNLEDESAAVSDERSFNMKEIPALRLSVDEGDDVVKFVRTTESLIEKLDARGKVTNILLHQQ